MEAPTVTDDHDMQENTRLKIEAETLLPLLSRCVQLHVHDGITSSDLAGVFILCYLGLRRPRSWSNGALKSTVSSSFSLAILSSIPLSARISSIPGLLDILGREYLIKKIGKGGDPKFCADDIIDVTVLSIFDQLQLSGIKKNTGDYVNRSIVCWAYGLRPFHLMFRIPSPHEVLVQQADGKRVITMFTSKKDLERKHIAMLYYMDGMQNHAKDSLEFLLHDMKHMEHFTDASIHYEQVGFFRCMLKLSSAFDENLSPVKAHIANKDANLTCNKNDVDKFSLERKDSDTATGNVDALSSSHSVSRLTRTLTRLNHTDSDISEPSECEATQTTLQNVPMPLKAKTSPRNFFLNICGYDKLLWHELEYVISDMNCYSTHLMQYVLAKMLIATKRLQQSPGFDPSILIISRLRGDELRIEDPGPSRRSDHDLHGIAGGSDVIIATNAECSSSNLKRLLLERWTLLLNLFGLFPDKEIGRADSTDGIQESAPSVSGIVLDHESDRLRVHAYAAAFAAAVGMVDTACKERGPLTADEGAALRAFFQVEGQGQVQGSGQGEWQEQVEDKILSV